MITWVDGAEDGVTVAWIAASASLWEIDKPHDEQSSDTAASVARVRRRRT
jgi:hypothetical protein